MRITEQELKAALEEKGNLIVTRNKITIRLHEDGTMTASLKLIDDAANMITLELDAEYENAEEFLASTLVNNLKDIDLIGSSQLWMQYLKGKGAVYLMKEELTDATLAFRIINRKTIVHSIELHFYDEEFRTLSLPEQFLNYADERVDLIMAAEERRYKFE